jgi:glutathione S-transferase
MPASLTLPFLASGGVRISGSGAIAQWGDAIGNGAKLFPRDVRPAIEEWEAASEQVLDAGRAIFLTRLTQHHDARQRVLPSWASHLPLAHRLLRWRSKFILRKYGAVQLTESEQLVRIEQQLRRLRDTLKHTNGFLLNTFTFADIAAASMVHYLQPVVHSRVPITLRSRSVWSLSSLASEFSDLIAYRDELYARMRTTDI